ncbi:MAG: pilin, partial [Gammaproteobacteria bacterium]|nr:pilin [Gammaproteobacteria bacterium]
HKQSLEHERLDKLYPPRGKGIGSGLLVIVFIAGAWFFADQAKRDYIIRAHVSAGLARAYSVKIVVEQYLADHGELPASNEDVGLPPTGGNSGDYVSQLGIEDGKIVIIYGNKANEKIHGKHLLFVPDVSNPAEVSWQCSSPDIPDKWLVERCRS